ncbi:MAG TPA: 6-phosphogluconolactonase [Actinomycetota bacterium]|nr:6-phosphogluconolactonase [Actinomycetota bacterium]
MAVELVVTDDVAGRAVEEFVRVAPRVVAVPGGRTPRPMYERLAATSYPWSEVDLLFTDERCVPPDHQDSNYGLVEESLLAQLPDQGPHVHRMPGATCDAEAHERALRERFGTNLRLDLAVLGIGTDGHTASLFPGDPALDERERWVALVERPGQPPDHPRLTLTLPVLSSARMALFVVAGPGKRDALRRLLNGDDIPAARIRAPRLLVLADPAAAGG